MKGRILLGAALAAALLLPALRPARLPGLLPSEETTKAHRTLEGIPCPGRLLVSLDFDPSSRAELEPQARAVLRHAFRRRLKVVALTLNAEGRDLAAGIVRDCAMETHAKEGEDWAFLGWRPGGPAVILEMQRDIPRAFPQSKSLPILPEGLCLADFRCLAAFAQRDSDLESWLVYAQGQARFPVVAGTSAVNAAAMRPFQQSGQIAGLLSGLRGAAEYERLEGRDGQGVAGMDGLALGSLVILAAVILANLRGKA